MTKGMKGDQLTIFRRSLRWLRICKDVGIGAVDYVMFLNHVDPDYEFSDEDLMAVYERLHDDGYLANVGRGQ